MEAESLNYETIVINKWFEEQGDALLLEGVDFGLYNYIVSVDNQNFKHTVWRLSTGELKTLDLGENIQQITEEAWEQGIHINGLVFPWDYKNPLKPKLNENCAFSPIEFIPREP